MQKAKFINKEKVIRMLSNLSARAKKKDKNIRKTILFGSFVNNTYTSISDADLLIILKNSKLRFIDRIPKLTYYFLDAPVTVDIFPYTEDEIENTPFAKVAVANGIELGKIKKYAKYREIKTIQNHRI